MNVGSTPPGLAITPDGSRVLVAGYGTNKVDAIDTRTNTIVWKTAVAKPHNLNITTDGRTAHAASQREGHLGLVIINIASGTQRGAIPLNHAPLALTVSPDGEEV
jgi:DNA-binding beta-propeller fold protein YncE